MNYRDIVLFCCVFTSIITQAAYADKEEGSEEVMDEQFSSEVDLNATMDMGPPDSHEAMNNREYKPKFTSSSPTSNREKRSYEFLLGLVNNNSRFQVTNTDEDGGEPATVIRRNKVTSDDMGASELLLELLVKIAAHPDHWEQVHNLLQKIDRDLKTSQKIVNEMQEAKIKNNKSESHSGRVIEMKKKQDSPQQAVTKETVPEDDNNKTTTATERTPINNSVKNSTREALKTNQWSYQRNQHDTSTTKYPWQIPSKLVKNEKYPRNFAYHRVTGNPLYHTNINNNPKAFIAVSVIAPKQMEPRQPDDELLLENELRELKPWTHNQNLKNMASIRSRWVIQSKQGSQQQQPSYAP